MNHSVMTRLLSSLSIVVATLFWGWPQSSNAQIIPQNAHVEKYGLGWECNRGYREVKGKCQEVRVPKYGYATGRSFDQGWDCLRGYIRNEERCVLVKVPAHAFWMMPVLDGNANEGIASKKDNA